MIDQVEELLQAGVWMGPAVLGSLCYRWLAGSAVAGSDDLAGGVLLGTAALLLTVAGTRANVKHASIGPVVFAAMFLASWSMR